MQSVCRWWHWVLYAFGLLLMVAGSILFYSAPNIFEEMVKKQMILESGTEAFKNWQEPPITIYMEFYMFNVTNPDDFLYKGAVPKMQQLGPYTYREKVKKYVFDEFRENGTVSYQQNRTYFFDREMSAGDESDVITTLNAPAMILVMKLKEIKQEPFATLIDLLFGDIIDVLESTEEGMPILRKTIAELLFQGYNLTFIESLRTFFLENLLMPEHLFDSLLSDNLPPEMSDNKFGFYRLNGTSDGKYLVGTGRNGPEDFADIKLFQGFPYIEKLPWGTDECNMINGTSGMVFPPFIDESSVLFIFSAELCRSVYLTYEQDVEFLGVPGLRFIVDLDVLEDPTINLANKCFCLSDGTCLKAGVLDVSACLGVPVVMSAPHFYSGSEEYYNTSVIEGMAPDENNHQTFIDIEPLTGIILNAAKKLQVNLNLKPIDNYPSFQNVSQMIFPIFWVNESASLSQELADDLYNKVIMPQRAVAIGSWVAVGVGLFTLLVVGAVALREYRRKGFRPF